MAFPSTFFYSTTCGRINGVMTPDPNTGLYRCAQARIAWIEVLIDRGWHSALERALEEVQANLLSDVRRIHFFDGRSWDEFRAAARVLQPGVMPVRRRTWLFSSFFLLE